MITKEMIRKGFEDNVISIEDSYKFVEDLCCRIGSNSFCFVDNVEDMTLSVDEYWNRYTLEQTIDKLYDILKDVKSAEDAGLCEYELEYYESILQETQELDLE